MSDQPNVRILFPKQERLESSAEGRQRRCRHNLRWQALNVKNWAVKQRCSRYGCSSNVDSAK